MRSLSNRSCFSFFLSFISVTVVWLVFSNFAGYFFLFRKLIKLISWKNLEEKRPMGLMHNYVIQCMRVRLGGIAKQVPPFFRECVFHFYILATNIPL